MVNLPAKFPIPRKLSFLLPVAIAAIALISIILLQLHAPGGVQVSQAPASLSAAEAKKADQQEETRLQLLKKLPVLGYNNLVADWTFLNFLQYFGDDPAREKTNYELLDDYFDVITTFDPMWLDMYPFLSTSVSFYQARPDLADQLMERGTKALSPEINPKAWQIWRLRGIDQLLLLGDTQASIKSHEMAAKWAENTPDQQITPRFLEFADTLRKNPDNKRIRIQTWLAVHGSTMDKVVRQRAVKELLALGVKIQTNQNGEEVFIIPEDKPNKK